MLLRLAESTWCQRLKTPVWNCTQNQHKSRQILFFHPLLLRLAQFVLSFSPPTASQPKAQPQITQTAFTINIGDGVKKVWIPNAVKDVFTNEVQIPKDNNIATTENVAHVAMLLFAGYINAATSMSESCGGSGSAPSSGWGKKDDEDDRKFAHRCAQMAHSMCKPKPRSRSFHR